eukprot:TRINITY_DN1595_c4_g1_i1.p1 TRINITY_DN1595_c4_g1~~TRINITY_DN1595_c4_g1_i1.p1  ORF type:complete len:858 (+),score=323.79 TRINITY_DN1595_c4_g1_i1:73-2574(+)
MADGVTTSLLQAVQRDEAEVVRAMVAEIGGCTAESRLKVWGFALGVDIDAVAESPAGEEAEGSVPDRTSLKMDAELLLQSASVSHLTQDQVEEVLTKYCAQQGVTYRSEVSDLVSPFLALPDITADACLALLTKVAELYAPFLHHSSEGEKLADVSPTTVFDLLVRLLLQYHDPEICTHLDQHKVSPAQAVLLWTRTLFVSQIGVESISRIWDVTLTSGARTYPTFLALAAMVANRDVILQATGDSLQRALNELSIASDQAGLKALHTLAAQVQQATPTDAVARLGYLLSLSADGEYCPPRVPMAASEDLALDSPRSASPTGAAAPYDLEGLHKQLITAVVLPIAADEMVEAFKKTPSGSHYLKYMILDCRAAKSFNFARLPTAVHVGPNVGYDPERMHETLERFEGCRGSHFCLLGTGKAIATEEQLLNMLAMKFVSAGFAHVGIAAQGFKGAIEQIKTGKIEYVRENAPAAPAEAASAKPAGESVSQTAKNLKESLAARAKEVDTDAMKKSAAEKAGKMKKWGYGLYKKMADKYEERAAKQAEGTPDAPPSNSPEAAAVPEAAPAASEPAKDPAAKEKDKEKEKKGGMMARFGGLGGKKKEKDKKDAPAQAASQQKKSEEPAFAFATHDSDSDDFQLISHQNEAEDSAAIVPDAPASEGAATPQVEALGGEPSPAPEVETLVEPKAEVKPEVKDEAPEEEEAAAPAVPEPELVFKDASPEPAEKKEEPAPAPVPAATAALDEDDLFADPILDTKPAKHVDPAPKGGVDDDDLFADPFDKKPVAAAPAAAAKKPDVDIFADDFDIDDIELPSNSKAAAPKAMKDDDFEDLFS